MNWLTLTGLSALGGLILNVTPCMLPVLSLKILNFIKIANGRSVSRILHGTIYGLGIVASFIVLAFFIIMIQAWGGAASWGFQFQNPVFLIIMIALCLALGIKTLFPGLLTGLLSKMKGTLLTNRNVGPERKKRAFSRISQFTSFLESKIYELKNKLPYLGSFSHGCLTTLIGSACCGPFLGYAVGMALGMSAVHVLLAFTAAGLGMALPYVILTIIPNGLKWVPKSGKWVKWIKRIAGSGMILTALWFLSILL